MIRPSMVLSSVQKRELSSFLVIYTKRNKLSSVKNHEKTRKFSVLNGWMECRTRPEPNQAKWTNVRAPQPNYLITQKQTTLTRYLNFNQCMKIINSFKTLGIYLECGVKNIFSLVLFSLKLGQKVL